MEESWSCPRLAIVSFDSRFVQIGIVAGPTFFIQETRYTKNTWWNSHEDKHHRDLGEWTRNNMMLYPPRKDGDPARPFEIYWGRANVAAGYKVDPLKRVCFSLTNMPITQALTYTYNLRNREGYIMYEILKEAQDYAAKEVEFPDNMYIAECFSIEFKTEFMPLAAIISKVKLSCILI